MKKIILLCVLLVACSSSQKSTSKPLEKASDSESVSTQLSKSSQVSLRPIKIVELENGLKIYFIEDQSLPRVSLQLLVKVGLPQEPQGLDGLNALTAGLLDQGTQSRSATKLADEFGQIGTEMSTAPGGDFTFLSAESLAKDKKQLLGLFSDVILNPAFKNVEIGRLKSNVKAGLLKKIDNPSSYTDDQFDRFLFGDHPYGSSLNGTAEMALRKWSLPVLVALRQPSSMRLFWHLPEFKCPLRLGGSSS